MSILDNDDDYKYWRDNKLSHLKTQISDCFIQIDNPIDLKKTEKNQIKQLCETMGFALFQTPKQDNNQKSIVEMNRQLGLVDFDQHLYVKDQGLAHITQSSDKEILEFIPYTSKAIGWHTDGYYNSVAKRIRAFSLFCVRPALEGGINEWIDPQMVYLMIREKDPDVTKALTHPKAMTIPEHKIDGQTRRKESLGPIFFIDELTKALYMRYTQRKKNIDFFDSVEIKQAVQYLDKTLGQQSEFHFQYLMQPNQGILCNNVLHKRSEFVDNPKKPRLLLRGRYFNRL